MRLPTLVNSPTWQSRPTYVWECLFAACYLFAVFCLTADVMNTKMVLANVLGGFAVYSSFEYMTVASRLEEAQARHPTRTVECFEKLRRILVRRELLWVATFALLGAWTSMAGVPLFLLYPTWRAAYRRAREVR